MTGNDLAMVLVPVVIAMGGGSWKVGGGLLAMSRTVDRLGVELSSIHDRLEHVEATLDRIAPPTVARDLGPSTA